ncbi:PXA domain containing protein [Elaphomyces granulatus]
MGDDDACSEPEHTEKQASSGLRSGESNRAVDTSTERPLQSLTLTDRILHFLSNASNEALLATIVCLCIVILIIFGKFGLLLIGFLAGVVSHASWEGTFSHSLNGGGLARQHTRRSELGIQVVNRLLEWRLRNNRENGAEEDNPASGTDGKLHMDLDYSTFRPATAIALNELTDAIIQNYVSYWYAPIVPSEASFPLSCRGLLTGFFISLSSHLTRKRPPDIFLQFVTNCSSMIVVFLNELSTALHGTDPNTLRPTEAIQNYLKQFPESNLANVLAVDQQKKKLKMVADDILATFLDSKAYECLAVRLFLREISAGVILESTIESCSRPEFINSWIIYLLQEGEPDIMNAIDAGVEGAQNGQSITSTLLSTNESILSFIGDPPQDSQFSNTGTHLQNEPTGETTGERKQFSAYSVTEDVLARRDPQATDTEFEDFNSTTTEGVATPPSESGKALETEDRDTTHVQYHELAQVAFDSDSHVRQEPNFTRFDQLLSSQPAPLVSESESESFVPTLCGASVLIDDGSGLGDKAIIRSKPSTDYSLQIEPVSSHHSGWMIFRRYTDFEQLHEALGRISRLNQISSFTNEHPDLPSWKGRTRQELRLSLEHYLRDALQHEPLAESERMRRFLEKDRGLGPIPGRGFAKSGFSFPRPSTLENVGKGMLEVLTSAPKGVAEGGKAVLEGVTGVFGNVGVSKKSSDMTVGRSESSQSIDTNGFNGSRAGYYRDSENTKVAGGSRFSRDLDRGAVEPEGQLNEDQSLRISQVESQTLKTMNHPALSDRDNRSGQPADSTDHGETWNRQPLNLTSNLGSDIKSDRTDVSISASAIDEKNNDPREQTSLSVDDSEETSSAPKLSTPPSSCPPISEEETQVAVELIFVVIQELYTLSSVWNIRRTLLNATKTYLLRPGNSNLEAIRVLLQETVIDANTSDDAIAEHIRKLRANSLPTEEELRSWDPPLNDAEKDRLRETARKLLMQRGLPQALRSVMGTVATREVLGRVFDCLQVDVVARGFVFAFLLQALRALIL